jgi:hypothetical protein
MCTTKFSASLVATTTLNKLSSPILFAVHSLSELGKDDFPANERTNKAIQPETAPCYTGILCDPLARFTLPLVLTVRLSARVASTRRGFKVHLRQSQHLQVAAQWAAGVIPFLCARLIKFCDAALVLLQPGWIRKRS